MIAVLKAISPFIAMHIRIYWCTLRVVYSARQIIIGNKASIHNQWGEQSFKDAPKRFKSVWTSGKLFHMRNETAIMLGHKKR